MSEVFRRLSRGARVALGLAWQRLFRAPYDFAKAAAAS